MTHTAQTPGNGPDRATLIMVAVLLSEDIWTDEQIAAYLKVSRRTLARWKHRDDLRLALDALALLQRRTFHRARQDSRWPYWPADAGPHSPNAWER